MAFYAMGPRTAKRTVAFLTVPESTGSTLYGMYDLFASVDRDWSLITRGEASESPFRPLTVAAESGSFRMANGVHVLPDTTCDRHACVPELLVPPAMDIRGGYPREVDWLETCYAAGSYVGSACSGALLLAEAGLLDGREATTHWAYCDAMARRYPAVRVEPYRALVTAGEGQRIVMVGGGSSW